MGNILDDLTGGKFSANKQKIDQQTNKVYSIFIQFDNDEPAELYNNIASNKRVNIVLSNDKSEFIFTDTKTGKTFKLFSK